MKTILILFLFLLPFNSLVTYTQQNTFITQKKDMDKKARALEFKSAIADLTAEDIEKAKDFKGWLQQWADYVENGLSPNAQHPTHKPPF